MSNAKSKVGIPAQPVDGVAAQLELHWEWKRNIRAVATQLQLHWEVEKKHKSSSRSAVV